MKGKQKSWRPSPTPRGRFRGSRRQHFWNITDLYTIILLRYWGSGHDIRGTHLHISALCLTTFFLPHNIHWKAESIPTVHENMAWYAGDS
jgi:hypothetical protein